MGKVIHTKDGRTLMKGPDGRWMKYSGEKKDVAEKTSKKEAEKKTIKDATKLAKLKTQYKLSDEAVKDLMSSHGNNVDLVEKSLAGADKIVKKHGAAAKKDKETPKKPFRRGHAINQKTPRTVKKADEEKPMNLIDIRNTERGRQIIDQLEEAEEEMRGRGLKDGDEDTWVYQKESAVEALKKEFGYDWDKPAKKSVPKNQVEVSDSHYVYSSGRRPSGNGNWAFYIGNSEEPIFFSGKYSEAKKKAIAEAAKRGVKKITLGS